MVLSTNISATPSWPTGDRPLTMMRIRRGSLVLPRPTWSRGLLLYAPSCQKFSGVRNVPSLDIRIGVATGEALVEASAQN